MAGVAASASRHPPCRSPSTPRIAAVLLTIGVLLILSALFSRAARFGVPGFLTFLVVGMLAGSEGIGGIPFDDYRLAFRLGTLALALILFDGGLNTPLAALRNAAAPAGSTPSTPAVTAITRCLLGSQPRMSTAA